MKQLCVVLQQSCTKWGLPGSMSPCPLVVSYTTVPSLPVCTQAPSAVYFCGTFLQLTLTGRYPALCPVEPGLSSRVRLNTSDCLRNFSIPIQYTDVPFPLQLSCGWETLEKLCGFFSDHNESRRVLGIVYSTVIVARNVRDSKSAPYAHRFKIGCRI